MGERGRWRRWVGAGRGCRRRLGEGRCILALLLIVSVGVLDVSGVGDTPPAPPPHPRLLLTHGQSVRRMDPYL